MGPVSGTDLGDLMTNRALELGAETEVGEVVALKKEGDLFTVTTDFDEEYQGRSVIIATGARPKTLGLPEEEQYQGNGECFCAVCDGAFYKDKVVAVCGGGNAALQDAAYLAELCRKVYLIHRRDTFRGEPVMVEKLRGMDNVEMVLGYQVKELLGGENLSGIRLEDASGQSKDLVVDGVFVAIGHSPANEAFREWIVQEKTVSQKHREYLWRETTGKKPSGSLRLRRRTALLQHWQPASFWIRTESESNTEAVVCENRLC